MGPAKSNARRAGEWAAFAACLLGILQWFIGAPDLRFGGFLFWMLPAVLFAPMMAGAMRDATIRALIVALSILMCAWSGGLTPRLDLEVPALWGRPPDPEVLPTHWVETSPGTQVRVPDTGDQCGDAELPCTPYPGKQALRDRDSLGGGFYPAPRP